MKNAQISSQNNSYVPVWCRQLLTITLLIREIMTLGLIWFSLTALWRAPERTAIISLHDLERWHIISILVVYGVTCLVVMYLLWGNRRFFIGGIRRAIRDYKDIRSG